MTLKDAGRHEECRKGKYVGKVNEQLLYKIIIIWFCNILNIYKLKLHRTIEVERWKYTVF